MKADFSRLQFNLTKDYTRVLQQQGRVALDADWNEQVTLQAELDHKRLTDLIGLSGVPEQKPGFLITMTTPYDLAIAPGVIYVNGRRVELTSLAHYSTAPKQPYLPDPPPLTNPGSTARLDLVYLCVCERHVTYLEDAAIREVALGGPDTTTRVQTTWQVRVSEGVSAIKRCEEDVTALLPASLGGGLLTTATTTPTVDEGPCVTPIGSGYRGLENRLYRVEVHAGGAINAATIKWSRDNGAIAFNLAPASINEITRTLELTRLGWDQVRTLKRNDWIELVSEADELNGVPGALVQIDSGASAVDEARRQITLKADSATTHALARYKSAANVKARLWNGTIGLAAHLVSGSTTATKPIDLEDGIQIILRVAAASDNFRSGDYWTFTARTIADAAGNTVTPLTNAPPHGPALHCCKLALIHWNDPVRGTSIEDCRPLFPSLTALLNLYYVSGDGQEAIPGNQLSQALIVRVNRGEHAVKEAPVVFSLLSTGNGKLIDANSNTTLSSPAIIYTDAKGFAKIKWQLDSARTNQKQQVLAHLDAPGDARDHLRVIFTANPSVAEAVSYQPPRDCPNLGGTTTVAAALNALCTITASQVTYTPPENCTNLAGATNVAEALDKLCNIGDQEDPGFHIDGLFWNKPDDNGETIALHEEVVMMERFIEGLCIACDAPPEPLMVKHATCFMQLELPLKNGLLPALLTEYTIPGLVTVQDDNRICWSPTRNAQRLLISQLANMVAGDEAILARLTIKGSYIHQKDRPDVYLDGDVTSTLAGVTTHNLNLKSGDGKRGGDFQTWFYVRLPPAVDLIQVVGVLHPEALVGFNTVRIVRNGIQILDPDTINGRLDALDIGYDHQTAVIGGGIQDYPVSSVQFARDRAITLMADSGLTQMGVLVIIQEEFKDLGDNIVTFWTETFHDRATTITFEKQIVSRTELITHFNIIIESGGVPSLIICSSEILNALDDDPKVGPFFQANFWRPV